MKKDIRAVIFDIDGVVTDGRKYIGGELPEIKSVAYKDLDAMNDLKKQNVLIGCISGEDTVFSRKIAEQLDYSSLGTKDKRKALEAFSKEYSVESRYICYIGDGKYDLEAMEYAGLAVCPQDAIYEVKQISDLVLDTVGGQGCIAELYTKLYHMERKLSNAVEEKRIDVSDTIRNRVIAHHEMISRILDDEKLFQAIHIVCEKIVGSLRNHGQLFLCGNGGSAADAQHLAAELVGRFYRERQAYPAEALSTNTSVLTSLANDYDYDMIFARQIEAKGREGDVLIGITTSGKSPNITQAMQRARERNMLTILMCGSIDENLPVLEYTDYLIEVPSRDTPRIQEGHILIGHIICEMVESGLAEQKV